MPKVIHYDTLETFDEVDGLYLSLVKADGEEDGFLAGPPCLPLVLNAPMEPMSGCSRSMPTARP
jgi:hypothetical protein